tara:strand:- start:5615 stop:5836 length:222 start_codon:yes stop_codon:yes gene_type:complete
MNEPIDEIICDICYNSIGNRITCILPCKHILCMNCIVKITEYKCHICRASYRHIIPSELKKKQGKIFEEFDRF